MSLPRHPNAIERTTIQLIALQYECEQRSLEFPSALNNALAELVLQCSQMQSYSVASDDELNQTMTIMSRELSL